MKIKRALLRSAIIAALGGLLFGFDTAVISGAEGTLRLVFSDTYDLLSGFIGNPGSWHGFTVASALIGTIIGSLLVGKPADKHGRRKILFVLGALYLISALGSALAWSWASFVIFRFIGGLAVGGSSVAAPMYNAEISPARFRGRMVALTQFNIVFGVLLAFSSNYIISSLDLGETTWRWMFGVEALPAITFFLLLFTNPRSPRWLIARNKVEEARNVIKRLGADADNVEEEIQEIQDSLKAEKGSPKEALFHARYIKPIMLAVAIAIFNQLSGINALMYYAPRIFGMAGFAEGSAMLSSVGVGVVNLIFTLTAMLIIDHFGRKKLMLVGSIGYIISLGATAWTFYQQGTEFSQTGSVVVLVSLLVFIAAHAFGQGAVIWVFLSEIFPNRVRARGQALGSFTHWFMAAAISWTFPIFAEASGGHIFTIYAICMVGQLIWVLMVMPETKGISLEKMQEKLGIR
ncbi:MAG: sugar porter family MFS transporter [Bacteroidales bacterium]